MTDSKKMVLIVERELAVANFLQEIFEEAGFGVRLAEGTKEAILHLSRHAGSIGAIIINAEVDGLIGRTLHFIKTVRAAGFKGPIIGRGEHHKEALMSAGCTEVLPLASASAQLPVETMKRLTTPS